jgi:predicted secreted protein
MSLLSSPCSSTICRDASCAHMTVQHPTTGRWFITMGHAQFNSAANNGKGYATQAAALRTIRATLARSA